MALFAFDGTWNQAKNDDSEYRNTNVRRFFDAYHANTGDTQTATKPVSARGSASSAGSSAACSGRANCTAERSRTTSSVWRGPTAIRSSTSWGSAVVRRRHLISAMSSRTAGFEKRAPHRRRAVAANPVSRRLGCGRGVWPGEFRCDRSQHRTSSGPSQTGTEVRLSRAGTRRTPSVISAHEASRC